MKQKLNILIFGLLMFSLTACDGLLSVDSKRLTAEEDYRLNSPNDSIYSMFGVFSQLQKLADTYVLLGELRAELMDVTETSDYDLREISSLNISKNNKYVNIKDFYAVINNCNYIIQQLDTSLVERGQQLKLRQFTALKAIRAWTYMQIALNFGTAKYYTHPILTVADAEKSYRKLEFGELADSLISDLEPVKLVDLPNLGYVESYSTAYSIFPVRMVLGDLYLWKGEFEKAAIEYREVMFQKRVIIDKNNYSYWVAVNNTISANAYLYWPRAFSLNSGEVITTIMCPSEYGQNFRLDTLNNQRKISASDVAINNWKNQTYYLNEASNSQGDLRMYGSISYNAATNKEISNDYTFSGSTTNNFLIYKYKIYNQNVIIYRSSILYLRYAEAVNRLNKPLLAMAVLKNGMNSTTLFNEKIVPTSEKGSPILPYINFSDARFNNNTGIRMRGLGNMNNDTTFFRIPRLASMADSVLYVDDLIQKELALETAFEGNRFHDLMRFALRRNDPTYLAKIVSEKHTQNKVAILQKLSNPQNWYIKTE